MKPKFGKIIIVRMILYHYQVMGFFYAFVWLYFNVFIDKSNMGKVIYLQITVFIVWIYGDDIQECLILILIAHATIIKSQEIWVSEKELRRLVERWNLVWVTFTLDGLSVYSAGESAGNVGLKLSSGIAEVMIRKVTYG